MSSAGSIEEKLNPPPSSPPAAASLPPAAEPKDVPAALNAEPAIQAESKAPSGDIGEISFIMVTNDGTRQNSIHLVELKNIFAKQLPKMPKEYIVRLVFDRRHRSMALCLNGKAIGGICYRPYMEQKFAEIAFCAITATEQVKGFGTRLMNNLKEHAKRGGIQYFLTYADNYAIGYFRKQGFTKTLAQPKNVWQGYIKDYDGAHLMECYIHPSINYLNIPTMIQNQREFIHSRIAQVSKSHVVYPGLGHIFSAGDHIHNPIDIPGVREAGWNLSHMTGISQRDTERERQSLNNALHQAFKEVKGHRASWPFLEPVDTDEVNDYLEVITDPIDLSLIEKRLKQGDYYRSREMLQADLLRMCKNCKTYNKPSTPYYAAGHELESMVRNLFKKSEDKKKSADE